MQTGTSRPMASRGRCRRAGPARPRRANPAARPNGRRHDRRPRPTRRPPPRDLRPAGTACESARPPGPRSLMSVRIADGARSTARTTPATSQRTHASSPPHTSDPIPTHGGRLDITHLRATTWSRHASSDDVAPALFSPVIGSGFETDTAANTSVLSMARDDRRLKRRRDRPGESGSSAAHRRKPRSGGAFVVLGHFFRRGRTFRGNISWHTETRRVTRAMGRAGAHRSRRVHVRDIPPPELGAAVGWVSPGAPATAAVGGPSPRRRSPRRSPPHCRFDRAARPTYRASGPAQRTTSERCERSGCGWS